MKSVSRNACDLFCCCSSKKKTKAIKVVTVKPVAPSGGGNLMPKLGTNLHEMGKVRRLFEILEIIKFNAHLPGNDIQDCPVFFKLAGD